MSEAHSTRSAAPIPSTPEQALVVRFQRKPDRWQAMSELLGPRRPTREARGTPLPPAVLDAVIWGLGHPSAPVRWNCLDLLDTHPDARAIPEMTRLLEDPVPRVRWHAVHALTCDACKGQQPVATAAVVEKLRLMAASDESAKVRKAAAVGVSEIVGTEA